MELSEAAAKKRKHKQYKNQVFQAAVKKAIEGKDSYINISKEFQIPYTTLRNRIRKIKHNVEEPMKDDSSESSDYGDFVPPKQTLFAKSNQQKQDNNGEVDMEDFEKKFTVIPIEPKEEEGTDDSQDYCTGCLNQTVPLNNVDDQTVAAYRKILGVDVDKIGATIMHFCDECKRSIKNYTKFRDTCVESLTFLSKLTHMKLDTDDADTAYNCNVPCKVEAHTDLEQSDESDADASGDLDFILQPTTKREVKQTDRYSPPPLKKQKMKKATKDAKARKLKVKDPAMVRRRTRPQSDPKWCSLCSKIIGCHWVPHLIKVHLKELDFEVFKCRLCEKVLKKSVITHHFENHLTLKEPIDCKLCGEKLVTLRAYRTHPERHVSYECHHCGKKLSTRKLILNHILCKHFNAKRCYICSLLFYDDEEYKEHMVMERKKRVVKTCVCDLCGFTSKGNEMMWHHKHKKHSLADVICNECGKKCDNWVSYLEHRRNRHAERKEKCLVCDQRFVTKGLLRKHMEMRHTESSPVACDICGKTYNNKTIKKHQQYVHFKKYNLSCQVCGRAFKARMSLNKHMYSHAGKRPYNCHLCQTGYYMAMYLKSHYQRSHGLTYNNREVLENCIRLKLDNDAVANEMNVGIIEEEVEIPME